ALPSGGGGGGGGLIVQFTCLVTGGDSPVTIAWYKSNQHPNNKHILFYPHTVLNQHSVVNQNSVLNQNSAPNQPSHNEYFQSDVPFTNIPLVDTPPPSSQETLGAVTGVDGSMEEKKNGGLVENHSSGENRVGMEVSGVNQDSGDIAANAFTAVKLDGELVANYPITDNRVIKEVLQSLQYSNALVPSQFTPSLLEVPRKNGGTSRAVDGLPHINGEMSHSPDGRQPNNGEMHFVTPEILPLAFPSEVQEGQLLQVSCAVSKGDDPLTLQWFKDDEPLESSPSFVINTIVEAVGVAADERWG
ncbi:hypothetical protein HAZT_HAZT007602, partial [Hyalella azteca]